ncbi:MAG: hypothetical protein HY545_01415 [Candidatus Doudnabacteria bacterium]|nr:hypothetical protein [Candidatus Doudnabacteria bacterium]
MTGLRRFLTQIQNKPYETRVKILWLTTLIAGVLLAGIWLMELKSTIIAPSRQEQQTENNNTQIAQKYISVERTEVSGETTKLFFSVNNDTGDILNFSTINDVHLNFDQSGIKPAKLLTRQDKPFVAKILSHTQEFGILVFTGSLSDIGELTFDQLFFESHPENIFKETISLDFDELMKAQELRN